MQGNDIDLWRWPLGPAAKRARLHEGLRLSSSTPSHVSQGFGQINLKQVRGQ